MVPDSVSVCTTELKFAVTFAVESVTAWLVGDITNPVLLGVTVYEPAKRPVNAYVPVEFAVVVEVDAPVSRTVAPLPPGPLIVPEMLKV
jgi:hypothetical protein